MALTGDKVTAMDTVSDTQNTAGTTTSTAYTSTLTGGTACGLAFVAPPSGKVDIFNTCEIGPGGTIYNWCTIRVRTGAVVGSGSDVLAASDTNAIRSADPNFMRIGVPLLVQGLTPGASYNVQQLFRVNSGTGTFQNKHLIVRPSL